LHPGTPTGVKVFKQINANSSLEYSTDISQAMRDALSPDGPSPAITFGDNIHWRVMLINARKKHVDFVDPFGTGFLRSVKTSIQEFYQRDKTGTWTFTEWTTRLQPRGDTWNMGNMDSGEVDAILESNRSNRGIC